MVGRQGDELLAPATEERVFRDQQGTRPLSSDRRQGRVDLGFCTGAYNLDFSVDARLRLLQFAQLQIGSRILRVQQDSNRSASGSNLVQKAQALGLQCRPEHAYSGNIASRTIEARDETGLDRVGTTG